MATELELKLMVQPEYLKSACDFLDDFCKKNNGEKNTTQDDTRHATLDLMNGYYDTSDGLLMKHGIALRIRAVNQQYIQTVKTRGSSRVGMHARGEWEWDLPSDALNLTLLDEVPLPDALKDMTWSRDLIEVFRTDFKRHVWCMEYEGAQVEVVCDDGEVSSAHGRDRISELELELKSGPETALYGLAQCIAQSVPVQVSVVSKAQKGVRIQNRRIEFPEKPEAGAPLLSFAEYWYEVWLVYWEAMFYLRDEALLQPVRSSITQLRKCLPNSFSKSFTALEHSYEMLLKQEDEGLLVALAGATGTGLVMLETGHWINKQID